MPVAFAAASKTLAAWGGDVGLTKHVYAFGLAEGTAEHALATMNAEAYGGQTDWKLLKKQKVDDGDLDAMLERIATREKRVDPALYPKIRGATGVFKVKPENVENHIFVQKALASDSELKAVKVKPADIGAYLIARALGVSSEESPDA